MVRTYGSYYPVSATSRDSIRRHADTRPFACTHAWNTDGCACSCRQQRHLTFPKGLVILQNYAITPLKQRCSALRSHTDLLLPRKKTRAAADCICHMKTMRRDRRRGRKSPFISVSSTALPPRTTIQHVSNLLGRSSYMQSNTYLCKGNRKMSATSDEMLHSLCSLCFCALRFSCVPLLWAHLLLSEAQETKTKGSNRSRKKNEVN